MRLDPRPRLSALRRRLKLHALRLFDGLVIVLMLVLVGAMVYQYVLIFELLTTHSTYAAALGVYMTVVAFITSYIIGVLVSALRRGPCK